MVGKSLSGSVELKYCIRHIRMPHQAKRLTRTCTRPGTCGTSAGHTGMVICGRIYNCYTPLSTALLLCKGFPILDTERWVRSWSRCTGSQPAGDRKSSVWKA